MSKMVITLYLPKYQSVLKSTFPWWKSDAHSRILDKISKWSLQELPDGLANKNLGYQNSGQ